MGYFDALTSSCFKTAQDGRKLFFPWGVWGRGYVVASEQDYERLRRQVKAYMVVALVPIIVTAALQAYVGALVIVVLLVAFYLVWMRFLLPGLLPSDERLSVQDSMTAQARAHSAAGLWFLEIGALAFVGLGIMIYRYRPRQLAHCARIDHFFRFLRGHRGAHARSAAARGDQPALGG
jgi:hypothetical protein